jgi:hypothetical protein
MEDFGGPICSLGGGLLIGDPKMECSDGSICSLGGVPPRGDPKREYFSAFDAESMISDTYNRL